MAKNIQMNYYNGSSYETCYPQTLGNLVIVNNSTLDQVLNNLNTNLGLEYMTIDKMVEAGLVNSRFELMSWSYINQEIMAGRISQFKVGQYKTITLNGNVGDYITFNNTKAYVRIIGINHNSSIEGSNKLHLQVSLSSDGKSTVGKVVFETKNQGGIGGWDDSYGRNTICPQFKATLPAELQAIIKPVIKYTDNSGLKTGLASSVTATTEEVFVPSLYEIYGQSYSACNSNEYTYQAYYEGFQKSGWRIKTNGESTTYYTRSASMSYAKEFLAPNTSTNNSSLNCSSLDNEDSGFIPCICI